MDSVIPAKTVITKTVAVDEPDTLQNYLASHLGNGGRRLQLTANHEANGRVTVNIFPSGLEGSARSFEVEGNSLKPI